MKKDIHPKWNKEAKVLVNGKAVMSVGSTSDTMNVEIWSGNHPFYTGKDMIVDVDNRVEGYLKKASKAQKEELISKKEKLERRKAKASKTPGNSALTLKDMISGIK